MMVLRRALAHEEPAFDLKGGTGVALLCLLISAWLHLVFFIAWQRLEGQGADRFQFHLEGDPPALELTLTMGETLAMTETDSAHPSPPQEPPAPELPAETEFMGEAPPTAAHPVIDETPLTAEEREAADILEKFIQAAQALDDGLTTEAAGPESSETVNPDPPISLENSAPKFKSYYTSIRSAVAKRWIMPPEAKSKFRPGRLTCDVTIGQDGTLLRIVVLESSGSATLDHAGLEAVRSAAPFPPFTDDLKGFSQLEIRMNFDYQAQYVRPGR